MSTPQELDWNDLAADVPTDIEPDADQPTAPRTPLEFPTGNAPSDPACKAERDRVLRHPHIAKRLCDPPQSYSRPEVWNGYIPSEQWQGRHNDSPVRKQLLDIVTAAVEADKRTTEETS